MPITIYTTSTSLELPELPSERTFASFPVIIGRSQSCHLILPDQQKYVSSKHAEVHERGGQLVVVDTSSNGTFLNGSAERIDKGQSLPLKNGDTLTMGAFKLQVSITDAAAQINAPVPPVKNTDDPFADPFDEAPASATSAAAPDPFDFDEAPVAAIHSDADHEQRLKKMGIGSDAWDDIEDIAPPGKTPATDAKARDADFLDGGLQGNDADDIFGSAPPKPAAEPAAQAKAGNLNDDDWDGWLSEIPAPAQSPHQAAAAPSPALQAANNQNSSNAETVANAIPHPPSAGISSAGDASMETLLRAAGLNPADFAHIDSQQLAAHVGSILNNSVQGMMLLLRSRDELKNAMRAEMTLLGPTGNNPLRFSASVEESLQKLLTPNATSGFTDANTAIDRALRDIKIHQLAMLEATRSALHIVLSHFEPDLLEANMREKSPLAANMPLAREAKLWEQFQQRYDEIKREALDDFSDIFGRELRKAYEQSTKRLKQSID